MRLLSVTIRNYRLHRDKSLELDPSRNLIGGPNESGKSTIVEAIHRGLFLRARGNTEFHRAMISTLHAGHPEVELRFEAGGTSYHLKKRFGTSGTATLTPSQGVSLSGEAAETELAHLLGVDGTATGKAAVGQWQHLWVWQGQSGQDPTEHANQHQSSLIQRLQHSGGAAAMQSALDERAVAHFSELEAAIYTQAGKPKVGSELERAETASQAAESRRLAALERLDQSFQAIRDFEDASTTIIDATSTLKRLEEQRIQNASLLARAEELRREEIERSNAAKSAREKYATQLETQEKITQLRRTITEIETSLAPQRSQEAELVLARDGVRRKFEATDLDCDVAAQTTRSARLRRDLAIAWLARFEKATRLEELQAKSIQVVLEQKELAFHRLELAKLSNIDPATLASLQRQESEWTSSQAALHAMAAGLDLVAATEPMWVDGQTLAVGESRLLTEETEVISGSGLRIRIRPGGGSSLSTARRKAADARQAFQSTLDALGVTSLAEASEVAAQRAALDMKIGVANANLKSLDAAKVATRLAEAQNDAAVAEAEVTRRSALVPDYIPAEDAPTAKRAARAAEESLEEAESNELSKKTVRSLASHTLAEAEESLMRHRQSIDAQSLLLAGHRGRLRHLIETHGHDENRAETLRMLLADKTAAEFALASTLAQLSELQPEHLAGDRTRLERSIEQVRQQRTAAQTKQAVAQDRLQLDGSIDPAGSLALAESDAKSTQEHLASVRRKSEAIRLLAQLFAEQQQALADQFTRPLADKISGYLQCLFGAGAQAKVILDETAFAGLQLVRPDQGGAVPFEVLSGGAQQQLAAAVRLAMAEVLSANHDGCLPVVFDDAFAFSDPERVEKLQRMLDLAASRGLQVIVLSCTPTDYGALGARQIALRREKFTLPQTPPAFYPPVERDLVLAPLSAMEVTADQRDRMLTILREYGGKAGSQSLREALGWDESVYHAVKNNLAASRHVVLGRGRGGSVSLPDITNA